MKKIAKASSTMGVSDFMALYLLFLKAAFSFFWLPLIPCFGVRIKAVSWLKMASSTALALLTDIPIPSASSRGK